MVRSRLSIWLQPLSSSRLCIHHAGSYNPAPLIHRFRQEMGAALASVSILTFILTDTCNCTSSTNELNEAFAMLAQECPALKNLYSCQHLPLALMHLLGQACPQLSTLMLCDDPFPAPSSAVRVMMQHQPTLFPQQILRVVRIQWLSSRHDTVHQHHFLVPVQL